MTLKKIRLILLALILISSAAGALKAQVTSGEATAFTVTSEAMRDGKPVDLAKAGWRYRAGDEAAWALPETDDSQWDGLEGTYLDPGKLPLSGWNGRGWFRLRFTADESVVGRTLALLATQRGASEVYLDGNKIASFGSIGDERIVEYNPNRLPIPFKLESAGEHVIAVRFASRIFSDFSNFRAVWLTNGGVYPGFAMSVADAGEISSFIGDYAFTYSMRIGFLFIGVLFALALLHFLLYAFYRVERGNLFYSIYAAAFGVFLLANNIIIFGHQSILTSVVLRVIASTALAADFTTLLAFLHVAFGRKFGKLFWILTALWAANVVMNAVMLNKLGSFALFTNLLIGLSFAYSIVLLVGALREKRAGAWILMSGVMVLMSGMTLMLFTNFNIIKLPGDFSVLAELAVILGVPVAVSVFLARNFARTNRHLSEQLEQVETLSAQQIEHERQTAELRAENERRARELEEARQLQLSMLPKRLPELPGLEIAAYMKPATEVGGDYYDFHVASDGTLTVAVGDATGHGLKAGTVVTATKSLFNNLAAAPDIPETLGQISRSLKAMNLRGLFMAMTMLKIKDNRLVISAAGMPSTLLYRSSSGTIEEINLRALPLGGFGKVRYREQEFELNANDLIVLMSDGFPEMFNHAGEMLGDDEARRILRASADRTPHEIIERLVSHAEGWAGGRSQDDDVTFVVLKVKDDSVTRMN